MPVYNAGKYLSLAIESILNQTLGDFEFLIFNDASTDDSLNIIKSYDDNRIKLINSPVNTGYVKHLNDGFRLAQGKFIARMDADDISLPTRFEQQYNYLNQNTSIDFVGSYITAFTDERDVKVIAYYTLPGEVKWRAAVGTPLAHPAVMFRAECIKKFKLFYDESYYPSEDYELWTRVLSLSMNISNIPEPLLKYRSHQAQTSAIKDGLQKSNAMRAKKKYIATLFKIPTKKVEKIYLFFNTPSLLSYKQLYSTGALLIIKAITTKGIDKQSLLKFIYTTVSKKSLAVVKNKATKPAL